jgi:ribosome-associated heat shock protein Hsp15
LAGGQSQASVDRQRIDRWLWHARIVRTRAGAAALVAAGHVRVNGTRVAAPGRDVKCGDVITAALHGGVRILKVSAMAVRRGDAATALRLYEELTEAGAQAPVRDDPAAHAATVCSTPPPSWRGRKPGAEND